ncbi:MAG: tetratricopeptide repeat protein [Bryobacteraceae bacterium]
MTSKRILICLAAPWLLVWAQPAGDPRAVMTEAMKLASAGRMASAEKMLAGLKQAYPKDPEIRYRLGVVLLRQRKLAEAESELEVAAVLSPATPLAWLGLAQARLQLGRRDRAIKAARNAAARVNGQSSVSRALAIFYVQAKEPARAVEEFQNAIRLDPAGQASYADLASLFLDHRTPEPAVAVLETAVARFPKHAEFQRLLGVARYGMGDTAKALDAFLQVIELDPDSESTYVSIETLLPEAGSRLDLIIEKIRAFSGRSPSSPVGHYLLALALSIRSGGVATPEELLRKAIEVAPAFWPAHFELHRTLRARDRFAEAVSALEKTIELNPDHSPSQYALSQLYAQLGEREKSRRHRELHHQLLTREREAAHLRRKDLPQLPYSLVRP